MLKLEKKINANDNLFINFFKIAGDDEAFHIQWYRGENDIICGHDRSRRVMINAQNVMRCIKKNSYVALCVITGFMKNISMNENSIISIDFS